MVAAQAARRGQAELSLVGVVSVVARAHHDAVGMRVSTAVLAAPEEADQAGHRRGGQGTPCSYREPTSWRWTSPPVRGAE
ncbi:hypothetical protein GCM10010211_58680 [Streptomyces albospinus]|uniref:Uncharacterized protein n=1 Tax=Streptomyces albospinus TaxID=285515 RepID=A0ABQ2VGY9_9ACTN|nr:hypothetical protein GCM10010211_58680 [Streptomyces albospinus]